MKHLSILTISLSFLLTALAYPVSSDERPNIIVIMADDLGYNDVGFTGETDIQTPVIDKLAANGVIFKNGYVTHPYCGPSRAGLLTGRNQARFGMENNVSYAPYDPYMGLPLTEKTFATRLKEVGYRTAIFGKWHLGAASHFQPNKRGFDYFYGFLNGGRQYWPEETSVDEKDYYLPLMRNHEPVTFDEYLTTALSRDAANYITMHQDTPFMMFVAYNAPHSPLQAPQKTVDKYHFIKDKKRRIYAAMVDEMDQGIGLLIEALETTNQLENTLIFFLSDNGGVYPEAWQPQSTWADNAPYRRGKVALLEGGVKVPFIAHWPAGIAANTQFDGLVSALDIAATSVALAGDKDEKKRLEGVNLIPFLNGEMSGSPHDALFWRLEEADGIFAVRTMDAKYMRQPLPGVGRSYFDMTNDPTEQYNLVDKFPEKQKKLALLWDQWNKKNIRNILLQSYEYKAQRDAFYKHLYQTELETSQQTPPFYINEK